MEIKVIADSQKIVRGILSQPCVVHSKDDGKVHVIAAGTQIEVRTNPNWQHDVSKQDIANAIKTAQKEIK